MNQEEPVYNAFINMRYYSTLFLKSQFFLMFYIEFFDILYKNSAAVLTEWRKRILLYRKACVKISLSSQN